MKQPLASVALVYAAGLVVGYYWPIPVTAGLLLCFVLLLSAGWAARIRLWLLIAALFLFGWTSLTVRTATISPRDLRLVAGEKPQIVDVRGRLAQTPAQRVFVRDDEESWRTVAELDVEEVQFRGGVWRPAHGRVLTITSGILEPSYVKHQEVEVSGLLMLPEPPVAPGVFDFRRYLASKGINYQFKVRSEDRWQAIGKAVRRPVSARFCDWGQKTLAIGMPGEDEALRLQWAMLLGWQTALNSEVAEPFMRSGTMHIFAISGLHIAMIAVIFIALLRAVTIPRFICGCIVLPVIWFYTAATGWQPSAVRSTVMSSVIILGWMLERPSNLLNSVAAAALIILVWDPLQLFQASFQLSFFVVLSLALLIPLLDGLKKRIFKLDPLVPMEVRPPWQLIGIRLGNWSWAFFSASFASFLGALPLTAYYFNLFTPGSLFANLLVVPMSAAALVAGLGSLVTGAFIPSLAELFNHAGWFFMRGMVWLSEFAAELPGSCFHVRSPGLVQFVLYYLVLIGGLAGWYARPRLRWIVIPAVAVLAVISAVQWQARRGAAEMTILPLPGSHMILGRNANDGDYFAINCGHRTSFDLFVKPFLQAEGVNEIERLVIARADVRHNGAINDLQNRFHIRAAFGAPHKSLSAPFRETITELARRTSLRSCATNGAVLGPFKVLHPDASDQFKRGQEHSVVLMARIEGVNVLFLSSLGSAGQNALYNRLGDKRADIIVTGMTDSGEPLAPALLEQLQPKLIIFADTPRAAFPAALQKRLSATNAQVIFTRDTGAVTLRLRRGSWSVQTALMPPLAKPALEREPSIDS